MNVETVPNAPEGGVSSERIVGSDLAEERGQPRTREPTLADIDRIDSLTLDDFAVDWSRLDIPQKAEGERLTSEELRRAVDSFLVTIREQ